MVKEIGRRISAVTAFAAPVRIVNPDKTHLLACGCSARVPVARGQAGGQVRCPACGAALDVPRLRDFERLEALAAGARPRQRWDAARGVLLAAAAMATIAGLAAVAVVALAARSPDAMPDPESIRAAVAGADTVEVHRAWQRLAEWGIDREPTEPERRQQAVASAATSLAAVLATVAGIGAAVALVAGWFVFRGASAQETGGR